MNVDQILNENAGLIFLYCLFYGLHMVEEFVFGFVPWADRYFGKFDWKQNLIGNFGFLVFMVIACVLYYNDPSEYLWAGMALAMWVLANAFLHVSCTILGREYSPGVVTAAAIYIPAGIYSLVLWGELGLLTPGNLAVSFLVGAMIFMLIPTFARAIHFHAKLATLFHLAK